MKGIAETGVLITGGCGDIGRAVAKQLSRRGSARSARRYLATDAGPDRRAGA